MHADLGPDDHELFWVDLHKHMTGPDAPLDRLDDVLAGARAHLDAVVALCYPFKWFRKGREGGIREETVGGRPEFEDWWARINEASAAHNDPGEFVTFPGFEWHGGRREYGDHNVVYRAEGGDLDDAADAPTLFENIRAGDVPAFAIPHHTGYQVGERGKDWDCFDPDLSPVMEVYSSHGSSEGVDTPVPMDANPDMGPRTSGGTLQDALDRGHHVGVVASNDGPGLPGTWNRGVAGVWAPELTREALWTAIAERRTFGVTGDRIGLWWDLDGHPMGATVDPSELADRTARVAVDCPRPLERVELLHGSDVVGAYDHRVDGGAGGDGDGRRVLVEFGWGPTTAYGDFEDTRIEWSGTARVEGGSVRGVAPRFVGPGNGYDLRDGACGFDLVTARGDEGEGVLPEGAVEPVRQGLVLDVDGGSGLRVDLADGPTLAVPFDDTEARVVALTEESAARIEAEFDLPPEEIENRDIVYHNARKVKVAPAAPVARCRAETTFGDLPAGDAPDSYYVRARQVDGQVAWGSPVTVTE
jgi:hypothetical protein